MSHPVSLNSALNAAALLALLAIPLAARADDVPVRELESGANTPEAAPVAPVSPVAVAAPEGTKEGDGFGVVDGQVRNYLMSTINRGAAQDWTQWAVGGQLGYRTPSLFGFSLSARFYVAAGPVGNSGKVDAGTGITSRYESGLFDFTDRNNKEVAILGEAYVDFNRAGHQLWAGRHRLKTPMLNAQDGRMIPSLFQGAWYQNTSIHGLTMDLGYISHVYARSGPGWGRLDNTLGIYPQGRTIDGTPASYYKNLQSAGIFVGGVEYKHSLFSVKAWDYAFENIFNVVYSDAFLTPSVGDLAFRIGAQYIGGQRLGNGGASDPTQRYFDRSRYHVFGGMAEVKTTSGFLLAANYNRVTADGPFLFPRELGVEPLFVFLKRERTEGSGDVHAFSAQAQQTWQMGGGVKSLSTALAYGHYYRTDPRQAALNKYGFPSLYQINWDTYLYFAGELEGLAAELLVVYKGPLSDTFDNARLVVNKVDMFHVDLIASYTF